MVTLSPTILSIRCECVLLSMDSSQTSTSTPHIRRMLRSISKDLHGATNAFDPHLKTRIDQALMLLNTGNMSEAKTIMHSVANVIALP